MNRSCLLLLLLLQIGLRWDAARVEFRAGDAGPHSFSSSLFLVLHLLGNIAYLLYLLDLLDLLFNEASEVSLCFASGVFAEAFLHKAVLRALRLTVDSFGRLRHLESSQLRFLVFCPREGVRLHDAGGIRDEEVVHAIIVVADLADVGDLFRHAQALPRR